MPASPLPETVSRIDLTDPDVAVRNEYVYDTPVAAAWLFDTDQEALVNAAAPAGATGNTTHEPTTDITARTSHNTRLEATRRAGRG